MARIKDSSVEAVKAAAGIVDVVSQRTPLRRSGARFTALCPFHEERTPSFSVSPEKGTYYCFGCQRGGDAISFVEETENVDFVGAIELLAQRFDVPLEYEEASPQVEEARRRRERLYALLEQATAFYERYLWEADAGETARRYLASRNLGEAVCREFRLGLAPREDATLARKARERGFSAQELLGAGLANRRGNDYFRGRLLFPIADARARVVGFQARRLHEDDPLAAKYVNSPEGELFRKGDLLYGLDRSRAAIARADRALVVEGNTDVLALKQAGVEPVVASMGTALTERQLKELSRLTRRLYLCFDADAAGEAATLRGMDVAHAQGFDVRVVALPRGRDPAEEASGFEGRLAAAESYVLYRTRLEIERAPDRQEAFVRSREILGRFEDSPERQEALRLVADRLDLPRETQAGLAPQRRGRRPSPAVSPKLLQAGERLERDALAGVATHPQLRELLAELSPEDFDSDLHRRARAYLLEGGEAGRDLVALLAELAARADAEGIDEKTAKELLLRLRERRLRRELDRASDERVLELQEALKRVRTAADELAWANAAGRS
jgi:DNA primase